MSDKPIEIRLRKVRDPMLGRATRFRAVWPGVANVGTEIVAADWRKALKARGWSDVPRIWESA